MISSNNTVWPQFKKYPLKTNMRLRNTAMALASNHPVTLEEREQLGYASMLIDISHNNHSQFSIMPGVALGR